MDRRSGFANPCNHYGRGMLLPPVPGKKTTRLNTTTASPSTNTVENSTATV